MIAGLEYFQALADDAVDKSVFIGDAARPSSNESVFEWFWLSDAFVGFTACLVDESVDAFEGCAIGGLPMPAVLPCLWGEDDVHYSVSSSWRTPWPASSAAAASRRRRALAGDRKR